MTIGHKIKTARLEEKLTQEQLAGTDVTKSYISEIERGRRTPRLITLKALARRLNRPLSYFLDGAPEDREAEVHLQLGLARLYLGSAQSAIASLEKALDLAVQQGTEALQARVELALAMVDQELGRHQQAQRRLDRCLRVFARAGAAGSLAATHCCLGYTKLSCGDPASAVWAFQAGLQQSEHLVGDPLLGARLYLGTATAHRMLGDAAAAREALALALEAARPFGDEYRVASWHLEAADRAVGDGRFDQAFEHVRRATSVYETLVYKRKLAEVHARLGDLERVEGNWDAAERHYRWSATLTGAAARLPEATQALSGLAEVLLDRGSREAARAICEGVLILLDGEADQGERAHVLRVLGAIYRMMGRHAEAKTALTESLALLGRLNHTDVRLVHQELALLALEVRDIDEAREHLETLQKI